MGNGFPGLAVVSLIALLAALAITVLVSLQPWGTSSVDPSLSVAPGVGAAVGDAVEVVPGRRFALAPARPAPGIGPRFVAGGIGAEGGPASHGRVAVAAAQVVDSAQPAPSPPAQGESPPAGAPPAQQPTPTPTPEAIPVAAPAPSPAPPQAAPEAPARPQPGAGAPGPVSSGGGSGGIVSGPVPIRDGDQLAYSFSFYVEPTAYREPGSENLILRFAATGAAPTFALQLWDDGNGGRGLWVSGDAMGGERFLAPLEDGVWHEAVLCFRASSEGDGFYVLLLDGEPIDARAWVGLLDGAGGETLLEAALVRDGAAVTDGADVSIGPAELGERLESVLP